MSKRIFVAMVMFGGFLLFAAGCATTGHKSTLSGRHAAGTSKSKAVASKSAAVTPKPAVPSRPAWVTKSDDYWVQGRQVMYRGSSVDGEKATALIEAENAARAHLEKNVRDLMLAEFRREISEQKVNAKTSETLASSFNATAEKTKIEGIIKADSYTEKVVARSAKKKNIVYRAYVLVKISMTDYDKCLRQTLATLRAKVASKKGERRLVDAVNAGLPAKLL